MLSGSGAPRAQIVVLDTPAPVEGRLVPDDLHDAFAQLDQFGRFFGAFAERETNSLAQDRWRRLSLNYQGTAEILRALLSDGGLILGELPPDLRSGILDDNRIVIDRDLDGRWQRGTEALRDELVPVLMQGLARRTLPQDWPWLADHLGAVGGLARLAEEPLARPLLARFFQAKDAYIWLAMQRIAQGDPAARLAIARRQVSVFETVRKLRVDMAATFGPEPVERLQHDWESYVAQVDGFAATRGWLLLDPALRQTQLGKAAQTDAVERAASEVVATAPRSALAAARSGAGRPPDKKPSPAAPVAEAAQWGVRLDKLTAQLRNRTPAEEVVPAPAEALPEAPDEAPQEEPFEAIREEPAETAAPPVEVAEEPDPQQLLSQREEELDAARQELARLEDRVGELDANLAAREEETARLETALAEERTRLSDAERRAAAQAATAEALSTEVQELDALKGRLAELERQVAARGEEARRLETALAVERARLAAAEAEAEAAAQAAAQPVAETAGPAEAPAATAPTPPAAETLAPLLSRIEQRQLYIVAAVGVIILLALLLWLRGRQRALAVGEPPAPLLLSTAAPEVMSQRPIIELPEGAEVAEPVPAAAPEAPRPPQRPPEMPRLRMGPGERAQIKVSGVPPMTPEAKAAMRAGAAKARADEAASPGREAEAAGHPMVQALRKGNLPLFELLFGEMTGLRTPHLQRVVYSGQGEDLLVVCRAVGIDKLLFGSIFLLTDPLRGGDADEDPARAAEVLRMYDRLPQPIARKVLDKWREGWSEETPREEETSLG